MVQYFFIEKINVSALIEYECQCNSCILFGGNHDFVTVEHC